ncbi:hypothetical protein ACFOW1_12745 [Parasediminibacterium paludis]|uniref:TonB dependent receptor n=1 Tax=Parasediminibacterium paludis TaxID=908966 RepID=A0ABV8PZ99_9BACT
MNNIRNILLLIVAFTLTYGTVAAQNKKKKTKSTTVNRTSSTAKLKSASTKKATSKVSNEQPAAINFKPITNASDTTAPKEVTITSSFKPSLRNAAKINFTAATPIIDTNKLPLSYNIPSSNLFFSYQPVAIKPVALFVDTSIYWHNDAYVKVGFGNFASPYAEAGIAFGDGKQTMFSLHGKHTSSTGRLTFQDFSKTGVDFLGSITTKNNNEISAKAFWDNSVQYRYGYQPSTSVFTKDDLRQAFNNVGLELGLQNKLPNSFGVTYHPQIKASTFFDNHNGNEISLLAKLPINKSFGRFLALDVAATADISSFKRQLVPNAATVNNNLFYVNPTIQFKTPNIKLNAGIQPTWDNQSFWLLPNVTAEAKINEEKFVVQAGWRGYVNKNTYQSLAGINPYIIQPTSLLNTKVTEQYAGFKGSAGKHFTYNARISFLNMDNAALYVNDTTTGKTQEFKAVFEPVLKAIKLHGEIGYTDQEKFSFIASANYTQFTKLNTYDKAYGLLPLEINGALRWKVFKDLLVKSDVFFWDGSHYQMQNLKSGKLSPAIDANIGTEFTVMPKLNVWLQINNVFNNKYQRWNQYEVLGLQVLGGVVYHF